MDSVEFDREPPSNLPTMVTARFEKWIAETYKSALAQTTEEERVLAYKHLEDWLKDQGRSDNSR